jgi:hypothetical protein
MLGGMAQSRWLEAAVLVTGGTRASTERADPNLRTPPPATILDFQCWLIQDVSDVREVVL